MSSTLFLVSHLHTNILGHELLSQKNPGNKLNCVTGFWITEMDIQYAVPTKQSKHDLSFHLDLSVFNQSDCSLPT